MRFCILPVLAALAAPAVAAEAEYLALKASFYDHDYGDFGGEFSSTKVAGCSDAIREFVRGMLQDTLAFDPAKGKKIPRPGSKDYCSSQLGKWFDPAGSRSVSCGNLFFRNVGDTARPVWRFVDTAFFPVDSLSPQRGVVLPDGTITAHDYAYCMELNAALDYAGGETLKIRGDDDTWVFLDGRLAADQGGIHFAKEEIIALDTLPFLKGKAGRTLDLDVYYCSRQPATAVFGMEAAARLRPLPLKSLQITDTAGRPLSSQDVLIGKARICARARFQSPGEEQCGNYRTPPDLAFLSADWDLNGVRLSMEGGQSCLDVDPAGFPDRTRLSLTARSSGLISRIGIILARPARPIEGVLAGYGRAERVELRLDTAGGTAPGGLEATFDFAGKRRWVWVSPDPARPWTLQGPLEGDNAGPRDMTGFAPVIAATHESIYGKAIDDSIPLRDGVAPALSGASLHWGQREGQPAWLELRASEALDAAGDSLAGGLAWKRARGGSAGPRWASWSLEGGARLILPLPAAEARALQAGDSVSLGPRIRDLPGNAARIRFAPISLPGNLNVTEAAVRVRPDPARGRPSVLRSGYGILIPVDGAGHPLDPSGPDAGLAEAGGPILEIPLPVPLARIHLRFHDHLGAFVNEAERSFTESEWADMRRASPGDTTVARLLWYPMAFSGNRLATGAYIVQGRLWTREGQAPGPGGEKLDVRPSGLSIPPRLFGYLRD